MLLCWFQWLFHWLFVWPCQFWIQGCNMFWNPRDSFTKKGKMEPKRSLWNLQVAFFTRWVEWEKSSPQKRSSFTFTFHLHILGGLQVLVFKCIKQWNWWNSTMSLVVYQLLETVFSWRNECILDGCIARFQLSEVFMNSVASTGQYPDLGGGFKYFWFSPIFGEDFQFD